MAEHIPHWPPLRRGPPDDTGSLGSGSLLDVSILQRRGCHQEHMDHSEGVLAGWLDKRGVETLTYGIRRTPTLFLRILLQKLSRLIYRLINWY